MRVLITGATGLIGKALVEKFFSAGVKVNFLTTKKSKIHSIKGASGFYWSPAKKILDLKCFDGVDSIIHLAGSRISRPWTKSNKKDILSSREIFTVEDGKVFDMHKTKEINDPRKINAFKQLFGNIGNFSAESFVNNY